MARIMITIIEKLFLLLSAVLFQAAYPTDKEHHIDMSGKPEGVNYTLQYLADAFPGEVGIAMISGRDTVCINGNAHFPMFSVVKFHQALSVSDHFRTIGTEMPDEIKGLLDRTLIVSDNTACDALFERVASPAQVEEYIHGLGVKECGIAWTEAEQFEEIDRCAGNWTTPLSAACLLGKFYENRSVDSLSEYVWNRMCRCSTGANRIPKYISGEVAYIAHKTGTGGPLPGGGTMGIGDIACIVLPDGRHFELAVFVKDASCYVPTCEELIAQVARICYESICK